MILDCSLLDDTSWMISLWGLWVISECSASFCTAFIWMAHFATDWITAQKKLIWKVLQNAISPHVRSAVMQTVGFPPCLINRKSFMQYFFPKKILLLIKHATHTECFHWFLVYSPPFYFFFYSYWVWYSCGVVCHAMYVCSLQTVYIF